MHIPAAGGALLGCLGGRVEDYSAVWAASLHGTPLLCLLHERWYSLYIVVGRHCVVTARPLRRDEPRAGLAPPAGADGRSAGRVRRETTVPSYSGGEGRAGVLSP